MKHLNSQVKISNFYRDKGYLPLIYHLVVGRGGNGPATNQKPQKMQGLMRSVIPPQFCVSYHCYTFFVHTLGFCSLNLPVHIPYRHINRLISMRCIKILLKSGANGRHPLSLAESLNLNLSRFGEIPDHLYHFRFRLVRRNGPQVRQSGSAKRLVR